MAEHTMRKFDQELGKVREYVLLMGGMVEKATRNAMQAMLTHDEDLAESVIQDDAVINALEVRCDELIRDILVRRQPVIRNLANNQGIRTAWLINIQMPRKNKGIAFFRHHLQTHGRRTPNNGRYSGMFIFDGKIQVS